MAPRTRTHAAPTETTDTKTRSFSMSIDINATPEDVWRALTDAGELMRWFPLQARVTPGKGGSVFWGWDHHWAWESDIEAWEPGKRLRLVENRPAFDVNGEPLAGPSRQLAMEFTLETHAGQTRLRIVHSGFGDGASWDDELDSVSGGWQFELRGLRHYLEHHKGRDRHHADAHVVTSLGTDEVWNHLLSPAAFVITDGSLTEGEHVGIRMATGDEISGTVAWHNPRRDLFVTVDDLNDGVFRLSTWRAGGKTGLQVWMTAYDTRHAARVREFGTRAQQVVERVFQ
jgi:uncharacterized protein YndB with AHSA1/START domain